MGIAIGEIFGDVTHRLCPFGETEAMALIRGLKGFPLLDGVRGRPKADVNPIIVTQSGAYAADAVVELAPSHGEPA